MRQHFLSCFLWVVRWEARTLQTLRVQFPFPLHQLFLGHPHKYQKLLPGSSRKPEASLRVTKADSYLPQGKERRELKQFDPLCCPKQAAEIYIVCIVRKYASPICFTGLCHAVSVATWQQVNLPSSLAKWNISSGIQSGACLESRAKINGLKSKMQLSNLESFSLCHQGQTHLLLSHPCRKQQIVLTQILSGAWLCHQARQPTEPGALHMQEDSKGWDILSGRLRALQLPGMAALRSSGQAGYTPEKSWACRHRQ